MVDDGINLYILNASFKNVTFQSKPRSFWSGRWNAEKGQKKIISLFIEAVFGKPNPNVKNTLTGEVETRKDRIVNTFVGFVAILGSYPLIILGLFLFAFIGGSLVDGW